MAYGTKTFYYGTGRRKKSIARVRLYSGSGKVVVNDKPIDEYFGLETLKVVVRQPLSLTETIGKFDVICNVVGQEVGASRSNTSWDF